MKRILHISAAFITGVCLVSTLYAENVGGQTIRNDVNSSSTVGNFRPSAPPVKGEAPQNPRSPAASTPSGHPGSYGGRTQPRAPATPASYNKK
jgi:hypothetical protein